MLILVEEELVFYILLFKVHSIPSNKVDTLKTKLWIEFDGEVVPSSMMIHHAVSASCLHLSYVKVGLDYGGVAREWFYLLSKVS